VYKRQRPRKSLTRLFLRQKKLKKMLFRKVES